MMKGILVKYGMALLCVLAIVCLAAPDALGGKPSTPPTGTCVYDSAAEIVSGQGLPTGVPLDLVFTEANGDQHFSFFNVVSTDGTIVMPHDYVGPTYVRADIIGNVRATGNGFKYTVYATCPLT